MPPPVPGETPVIPDYELLRVVGRGAYGDVWLARGLTGVYRAIKVVWRDRFPDAEPYEHEFGGLRSFARISLREPHQLALLHVGRNDTAGFFYYVMELADDIAHGQAIDPDRYTPLTLKRWLELTGAAAEVHQVVQQAADLARALSSLHEHGLVHRDIKPSNLLVIGGRPKLADIGLVTDTRALPAFVGTEGFVPPEGSGTPQADVYSLGKVLYEMATGRDRNEFPRLPDNLHERKDRAELLELNEVIVRACDPSPTRRHADGTELLEELRLLQSGGSVRHLRRTEQRARRAHRVAASLALAAGLALVGALHETARAQRETSARRLAEAERDRAMRRELFSRAMMEAEHALDEGETTRALALLAAHPPAAEPAGPAAASATWERLMARAVVEDEASRAAAAAEVPGLQLSPLHHYLAGGTPGSSAPLIDPAGPPVRPRTLEDRWRR